MNRARKERTELEFAAFEGERERWIAHRRDDDPLRQHGTQLASIEDCLREVAANLRASFNAIPIERPVGEVYEACLQADLSLGWLRRIWHYYRLRFDQRDEAGGASAGEISARRLLRAADDVVWSCYQPVIKQLQLRGIGATVGVAPLPHLVFEHSPAVTPATSVPLELKRDGGALLEQFLATLPAPVVHLPATCLRAPWWLVFIGHEVGHCIEAELGVADAFADRVAAAARSAGADAMDAEAWRQWSGEIFADVFSALSMGKSALRGLVEFERRSLQSMRKRRRLYPAGAVRLELLARTLDELGLGREGALAGMDPRAIVQGEPELERDMKVVPEVVRAALEPLPLPGREAAPRLAELVLFRKEDFEVAPPLYPPKISTARLVVSRAVQSWSTAMDREGADWAARHAALGAELVKTLEEHRLGGQRGGGAAAKRASGAALADIVRELGRASVEG